MLYYFLPAYSHSFFSQKQDNLYNVDKSESVACGFFLKTGIIASAKQSYKKNNSWVDIIDLYGG